MPQFCYSMLATLEFYQLTGLKLCYKLAAKAKALLHTSFYFTSFLCILH